MCVVFCNTQSMLTGPRRSRDPVADADEDGAEDAAPRRRRRRTDEPAAAIPPARTSAPNPVFQQMPASASSAVGSAGAAGSASSSSSGAGPSVGSAGSEGSEGSAGATAGSAAKPALLTQIEFKQPPNVLFEAINRTCRYNSILLPDGTFAAASGSDVFLWGIRASNELEVAMVGRGPRAADVHILYATEDRMRLRFISDTYDRHGFYTYDRIPGSVIREEDMLTPANSNARDGFPFVVAACREFVMAHVGGSLVVYSHDTYPNRALDTGIAGAFLSLWKPELRVTDNTDHDYLEDTVLDHFDAHGFPLRHDGEAPAVDLLSVSFVSGTSDIACAVRTMWTGRRTKRRLFLVRLRSSGLSWTSVHVAEVQRPKEEMFGAIGAFEFFPSACVWLERGSDPMLSVLDRNGGLIETHALPPRPRVIMSSCRDRLTVELDGKSNADGKRLIEFVIQYRVADGSGSASSSVPQRDVVDLTEDATDDDDEEDFDTPPPPGRVAVAAADAAVAVVSRRSDRLVAGLHASGGQYAISDRIRADLASVHPVFVTDELVSQIVQFAGDLVTSTPLLPRRSVNLTLYSVGLSSGNWLPLTALPDGSILAMTYPMRDKLWRLRRLNSYRVAVAFDRCGFPDEGTRAIHADIINQREVRIAYYDRHFRDMHAASIAIDALFQLPANGRHPSGDLPVRTLTPFGPRIIEASRWSADGKLACVDYEVTVGGLRAAVDEAVVRAPALDWWLGLFGNYSINADASADYLFQVNSTFQTVRNALPAELASLKVDLATLHGSHHGFIVGTRDVVLAANLGGHVVNTPNEILVLIRILEFDPSHEGRQVPVHGVPAPWSSYTVGVITASVRYVVAYLPFSVICFMHDGSVRSFSYSGRELHILMDPLAPVHSGGFICAIGFPVGADAVAVIVGETNVNQNSRQPFFGTMYHMYRIEYVRIGGTVTNAKHRARHPH